MCCSTMAFLWVYAKLDQCCNNPLKALSETPKLSYKRLIAFLHYVLLNMDCSIDFFHLNLVLDIQHKEDWQSSDLT